MLNWRRSDGDTLFALCPTPKSVDIYTILSFSKYRVDLRINNVFLRQFDSIEDAKAAAELLI